MKLILLLLFATSLCQAQQCPSIGASMTGNWRPLHEAPRGGRVVEVLNTYGVAPTYGLFRFVENSEDGYWSSYDGNSVLVSEACMFFRPFTGDPNHYVDPTHGRQFTTKYWCDAMHRGYDRKRDVCE